MEEKSRMSVVMPLIDAQRGRRLFVTKGCFICHSIKGVGGMAHVKDISCQGKAIWVVYGNTTNIENVRFSGARVEGRNGAGIRFEGGVLRVKNVHIHDNQMGILTHNRHHMWLVVIDSLFERNGNCPRFCGHGVYAGKIRGLKVINSKFRDHRFGHHIKSRAAYNEIVENDIDDGERGTASFAIEMPNGGTAKIRRNRIVKGPRSNNKRAVIAIGQEGIFWPSRGIEVSGNTIFNRGDGPTNFVFSRGVPVSLSGNRFEGKGTALKKTGAVARKR